jgi:hypothetical protein
MLRGQRDGFLRPYSRFSRPEQLLNCTHEAEWTPFQTHFFLENLIVPGIEPGTSGSVARNSDHYNTEAVIRLHYLWNSKFPRAALPRMYVFWRTVSNLPLFKHMAYLSSSSYVPFITSVKKVFYRRWSGFSFQSIHFSQWLNHNLILAS